MKPILKPIALAFLLTATGPLTFAGSVKIPVKHSSIETQDRKLSGFHALASSGSFDVVLSQGNTESVRVKADADVINEVVTEVKNGTLMIHAKNNHNWGMGNFWNNKTVTIYVTAKDLNSIGVSGSGDLKIENAFNTNTLALRLSGSGDFSGKVNVKTLEAAISGSGDFKIAGRADDSNVAISGSGNFEAGDLITKTTVIRIAGSGDAHIYASEKLDASVSGSGDVRYSGHPKSVSKVVHGSGDVSGS
ncbi:MAG: head GIN domain-containing protein [Mucilaginibacter sp.]|uniref:head GIN domain-containing protein n=1 Tax=Mucilaginibacter sp. TaxID=1882438 RepID=UPI0034E3CF25